MPEDPMPQEMHSTKVDELLDNALSEYSNAAPRPGLEGRILARLSTAAARPEAKTWLRWWPAWGLAAATVIVLVVFFAPRQATRPVEVVNNETPKTITHSSNQKQMPQLTTAIPPAHLNMHTSHRKPAVAHVAVPQLVVVKLPVFPAPAPLTDQERLLFAYVQKTDAQEIAANSKPDDFPSLNQQLNEVVPLQKSFDRNTNSR